MLEVRNHVLDPNGQFPIFISAGVLKEPGQLQPFINAGESLSGITLTLGSFSLESEVGNSARFGGEDFVYYPEKHTAGNCIGLRNGGADGLLMLKDPIKALTDMGIKTIISITNLPSENPTEVIGKLARVASSVNPTAIEINLSCPNGKSADGTPHKPLCYFPEDCVRVVELARAEVGNEVCLGVKDSPHVNSPTGTIDEESINYLLGLINDKVDFVTGINTIGLQSFPELTAGKGLGGMSGPVVSYVARQHLMIVKSMAPDLAYLSCGGVDTSNASSEITDRLKMGALLVGGAQEFYRSSQPHKLLEQWAQNV